MARCRRLFVAWRDMADGSISRWHVALPCVLRRLFFSCIYVYASTGCTSLNILPTLPVGAALKTWRQRLSEHLDAAVGETHLFQYVPSIKISSLESIASFGNVAMALIREVVRYQDVGRLPISARCSEVFGGTSIRGRDEVGKARRYRYCLRFLWLR